jgi:hypothetical protein
MENESIKNQNASRASFYGDHNNNIHQHSPEGTNVPPFAYQDSAEALSRGAHSSSHDVTIASPNQPSVSATSTHQSAQLQGVVMIGPG